jgi:hypothetical protein
MLDDRFSLFLQWERASRDTIDFKKIYVDIAGDLVAGLALSQIIYWYLPSKDGVTRLRVEKVGKMWIAKRRAEWWDECRLTPKQVDRALDILRDLGLIETEMHRFDGLRTTHLRLIEEKFVEAWKGQIAQKDTPVLPKGEPRSYPKGNTEVPQRVTPLTETTTETTAETTTGGEARKPRARNPLFDAIAEATGTDTTIKANGGHIAKVCAELTEASPPYTPEDVRKFSEAWWEIKWHTSPPTVGQLQQQISHNGANGNGKNGKSHAPLASPGRLLTVEQQRRRLEFKRQPGYHPSMDAEYWKNPENGPGPTA